LPSGVSVADIAAGVNEYEFEAVVEGAGASGNLTRPESA